MVMPFALARSNAPLVGRALVADSTRLARARRLNVLVPPAGAAGPPPGPAAARRAVWRYRLGGHEVACV